MNLSEFRARIERAYELHPTGCGSGFDEIETYDTGLTFRELAKKWGITCAQLGELISDHCNKLD